MKIWESIVLGLVQGATEFLPISSSGHLLLLEKFGIGEENLFFNVCLHLGTLVAVLIALRKEWLPLVKHPFQKKTGYLILACVPTVIIAVIFKVFFPNLLSGQFLGLGFVITACLLFATNLHHFAQNKVYDVKNSILCGVCQGIAVLPGISRSGATIASLMLSGIKKEDAASFSFLLSIPIILGSAIVETAEVIHTGIGQIDILPLVIGVLCAFVSGLVSIKFFLKLIAKKSLVGFGIYTLILGIIVSVVPLIR